MSRQEKDNVRELLQARPDLVRMFGLSLTAMCDLLENPSVSEEEKDEAFSSLLEMVGR